MGLGKILGAIGAGVAAPFTGGTSLAFLPGLLAGGGELADILGGAAKGRAGGQQANEQLGIARSQADLARRKYMLEAPGERLGQAKKASMIANFQPTQTTWGGPGSGLRGEMPQITGGFNNPNIYSPETKQLADNLIHQHLMASLGGADNVPELPQIGKSSWIDKLLGGGAFAGSIMGALGKMGVGGQHGGSVYTEDYA